MSYSKHLFVGGLVAMGFDSSGEFLLAVTHSGRGVFAVGSWELVARDATRAYPDCGRAVDHYVEPTDEGKQWLLDEWPKLEAMAQEVFNEIWNTTEDNNL